MIVLGLVAAQASADDTTDIGIKGEIFRSNQHGTPASATHGLILSDPGLKALVSRNPTPINRPSTLATALVI